MALSLSLSSTTIAICLFSFPSPSLSPCLPPSCQGVYMCPADGRVPNKVERIRGEKTVLLPAMFSLFSSISLSRSLALTVDIFQLMYSWPLLPWWRINKTFIYILNNKVLAHPFGNRAIRYPSLVSYFKKCRFLHFDNIFVLLVEAAHKPCGLLCGRPSSNTWASLYAFVRAECPKWLDASPWAAAVAFRCIFKVIVF